MLGPYFRGLGKRKNSDDEEEEKQEMYSWQIEKEPATAIKKRHISRTDAELIPKFDPGKKATNMNGWLHKIEQLGSLYDWDDRDKIIVMQIRLRGAAREWYDDLDDYAASWNLWKEKL